MLVISPAPDRTPRDDLRTGSGLVFDLAALGLREQGGTSENLELLGHLRALVDAALINDQHAALTQGLEILERLAEAAVRKSDQRIEQRRKELQACMESESCTDRRATIVADIRKLNRVHRRLGASVSDISRLAPIATALASNAQRLKAEAADPAQREALRQARKETIEEVIDASTRRDQRGGDLVFSVGMRPGFRFTSAIEGKLTEQLPPITIPVGFGIDLVQAAEPDEPRAERRKWHRNLGFHAELALLDIGAYLEEENLGELGNKNTTKDGNDAVLWNDLLIPSVNVGVVFARSIVVGAEVAFTPFERRPSLQIGAGVSFYIPLLDLN